MLIDYTYIINLNTSDDEIVTRLRNSKFPKNLPFYVAPAINGWEVTNDTSKSPHDFKLADWWNTNQYGDKNFYNREVTPGEAGCTLSHYNIIYNAFKEGFNNILILEEDFYCKGKFPTHYELDSVPTDASIIYLDKSQLWEEEERINDHVTEVGYTYCTHAYIITRKGMKEVLDSNILNEVIVIDEFYSAINGKSDRLDAVDIFNNPNFKAYALNGGYFGQSSDPSRNSLTEFNPTPQKPYFELSKEYDHIQMGKTGALDTPYKHINLNLQEMAEKEPVAQRSWGILDGSDWGEWSKKYIHPLVLSKEYDLISDEPIPHVYNFPFFTKEFCKEIIELSETVGWTNDRHEFYPTTDNLLSALGMQEIYTRVINEYVRPMAIHFYQLDGHAWDKLNDESFIIRYKPEEQAHLGIHHDHGSVTTLVNLNPGEFKGGGTYFPKFKHLSNPQEMGVMSLHPSNITHKHVARPVTEGTRYVIVSFCKNQNMK